MNTPIVTNGETVGESQDSLPNIDFKALGEGIIENGADFLGNSFNVGIDSTFDKVVESV